MALSRLKAAAEQLRMHPVTLRRWADEGRGRFSARAENAGFAPRTWTRSRARHQKSAPPRGAVCAGVPGQLFRLARASPRAGPVTGPCRSGQRGPCRPRGAPGPVRLSLACWKKTGFWWRWPTPGDREEGWKSCWRTSPPWLPPSPDGMYGIRSKKAQRRLLAQAQQKVSGDDKFTG
jgi:hypothetical protein